MFEKDELPFIIAEVGQNHNGQLDIAREYIKVFADAGADAIKFQTRENKFLFSESAYNARYDSENAFAETYGAHREKLELKPEWLPILKEDCVRHGVKFMSTPFDEPSLELLISVGVDIIKIASFDTGNLPFINKIAQMGKPTVISIGGAKAEHIKSSVDLLAQYKINLAILHCVSEYPCTHNRLGLDNIDTLAENFPGVTIGLSDHFNGILSGPIAYMKGARVFEKHVTFNRSSKGTDHSFSLEPEGFRKFARDIRRVREMLPPKPVDELGKEVVFKKLGKSLIAAANILEGESFTLENLSGRIFDKQYIPVRESINIIGKTARKRIAKGDPITQHDISGYIE